MTIPGTGKKSKLGTYVVLFLLFVGAVYAALELRARMAARRSTATAPNVGPSNQAGT